MNLEEVHPMIEFLLDLARATTILFLGILAFWFFRVGIGQLVNRDEHEANRARLGYPKFWDNFLGRVPNTNARARGGGYYDLKTKQLVSTTKLSDDEAKRVLKKV